MNTFFKNLFQLKWYIWILFSIFFCIVITTAIRNHKDQMILFAACYSLVINGFVFYTYARYFEKVNPVPDNLSIGDINETKSLKLSEILLKEFDYAHDTASQAMNDRHTMVNYFLIITGVIITLIGTFLKTGDEDFTTYRNTFLFIILLSFNFIGWIYFFNIIRLRQAWMESALEMNHIKQFYLQNLNIGSVGKKVFRWNIETQPKPQKSSNVFYYSAFLISFFISIAIIVGWFIAIRADSINGIDRWGIYLIGFFHFIFQMLMYTEFLRVIYKKEEKK